MGETEKQEEDLVGEHEKEDEGRARTVQGEQQGAGGNAWLKFLREMCRRSQSAQHLPVSGFAARNSSGQEEREEQRDTSTEETLLLPP